MHRGGGCGGDFVTVQLCPVGGTVVCDHHLVALFGKGGVQAGELAVTGHGEHGFGPVAADRQLAALHLALQHGAVGAGQGDGGAGGRRSGAAAGVDLGSGLLLLLVLVGPGNQQGDNQGQDHDSGDDADQQFGAGAFILGLIVLL